MRKVFNSSPADGMQLVNKKYDDVSYKASKEYIIVECRSEDSWYVTVYLRPYKNNKTIITAYVPQLDYFDDVKYYSYLSDSIHLSEETLKVIKPSEEDKSFFVSEEKDITGESKYGIFHCVHKIIDVPLSAKILNQDFDDYKIIETSINEIIHFVNSYLYDISSSIFDFDKAQWVKKVSPAKLKAVIQKGEKSGFLGHFIGNIKYMKDENLKALLLERKMVLVCNEHIYDQVCHIEDEEKEQDALMFIMAEVFDASFKDSGYLLVLEFEASYSGWYPKIHLGGLVKGMSIMLNDVHTKKWTPIKQSTYDAMPTSTEIWFYTNPYHSGVMIHRFISDGDKEDRDASGPSYVVQEPDYIKSKYSLDDLTFWTEKNFCWYIANSVETALTVILEFEKYCPSWKRKQIIGIGTEVITFLINPWKYVLKKKLENK